MSLNRLTRPDPAKWARYPRFCVLFVASLAASVAQAEAATRVLSAEALVADVLEGNRGLDALRAAARAAESVSAQDGALPDPILTGVVAPETVGGYDSPSGRGANVRIELSQQLPWPGKLDLKSEAAQYEALAAGERVAALRLHLAALTRGAYSEWFYVHAALDINAANRRLVEQLRNVAEERYAAGLTAQQDVLQAEVELQHVYHRKIELSKQRRVVQARINTLLNQAPDAALPPPADQLPAPSKLPDLSTLRERTLTAHPELQRLQQRASANERRERLADKDFYPDLRVFTGYNGLWDDDAKRWVVGIGVNLPLDRQKRRAAVDEARSHSNRIQSDLDDQRAQLLGALEQALAAFEETHHTIRLYQNELIPRSEENLAAARAAYGAGGGSFSDVITAEKLLLDARLGLQRASADNFAALAEVERWTGGKLQVVNAPSTTPEGTP